MKLLDSLGGGGKRVKDKQTGQLTLVITCLVLKEDDASTITQLPCVRSNVLVSFESHAVKQLVLDYRRSG